MCYFLYGAVNCGLNEDDYNKVIEKSNYHFNFGNIKDVNACVGNGQFDYRITLDHCDCDTPIGSKHTNQKDLKEFEEVLLNLKNVQGIKYVLFSKNWWGQTNSKQEIVHIETLIFRFFLHTLKKTVYTKLKCTPNTIKQKTPIGVPAIKQYFALTNVKYCFIYLTTN